MLIATGATEEKLVAAVKKLVAVVEKLVATVKNSPCNQNVSRGGQKISRGMVEKLETKRNTCCLSFTVSVYLMTVLESFATNFSSTH